MRFRAGAAQTHVDRLAVEAPLTLVLDGEVLVTTMRTPGSDTELVCGWLINESDVFQQGDIETIQEFAGRSSESDSESKDMEDIDTVLVTLAPGINGPRPKAFMTTSACGVCSSDILAAFAGPKADLAHENWRLNAIQCETMIEECASIKNSSTRPAPFTLLPSSPKRAKFSLYGKMLADIML